MKDQKVTVSYQLDSPFVFIPNRNRSKMSGIAWPEIARTMVQWCTGIFAFIYRCAKLDLMRGDAAKIAPLTKESLDKFVPEHVYKDRLHKFDDDVVSAVSQGSSLAGLSVAT